MTMVKFADLPLLQPHLRFDHLRPERRLYVDHPRLQHNQFIDKKNPRHSFGERRQPMNMFDENKRKPVKYNERQSRMRPQ